jgi:hypothetical protein
VVVILEEQSIENHGEKVNQTMVVIPVLKK